MTTVPVSDLGYPDRFYAAMAYAGFGESAKPATTLSNETTLLLYGLYQQATIGPCNVPRPRSWNSNEQKKWESWNKVSQLSNIEAMRLFVKILEEEDPAWYSRVSKVVVDTEVPLLGSDTHVKEYGTTNGITKENGSLLDAEDKGVVLEGLATVSVYDHWTPVQTFGRQPKPRYEHAAEVVDGKLYIIGGNYNGRYLNDIQVLDLNSLRWSKIEPKVDSNSSDADSEALLPPCAGHSLVPWGKKILAVAGHIKDSNETVTVRVFDIETQSWSMLKTYGKAPLARGGQSVNLTGSTLVMFGGEDSKRHLLNDVHILDLETLTWDAVEGTGTPPTPRSDHTATVHLDRYLMIFGGGSHSTCFSDVHVLDMQTMEWSQPQLQGHVLTPRAGHAGVSVGEYWYIVGGGDNKSGVSETLVLNMSKLVWDVVTTVEGRVPIACEGLTLVSTSVNGEDVLIAFGGYNGKYSNEVHILKPSQKQHSEPKILQSPAAAAAAASVAAAYAAESGRSPSTAPETDMVVQQNNAKREIDHEQREKVIKDLKLEKEELQASLSSVQSENADLRQRLFEVKTAQEDLTKELQSVRGQLASEQSRSFKLEVNISELKQKLSSFETLQKEVELLRRQKAIAEEAALNASQKQSSGGVWGWIAGTPASKESF